VGLLCPEKKKAGGLGGHAPNPYLKYLNVWGLSLLAMKAKHYPKVPMKRGVTPLEAL